MARVKDRERATKLRMQGLSYSAISQELGINKSTLSGWLSRYPLSESRIRELRGSSPQRIERFRNTMFKKRNVRLERVYKSVVNDFKKKRFAHDLYAGFFLYWGEGTKAARYTTALTNSDPNMIRFFIQWLSMLGVKKKDLRLKLHLYADMDIKTAHLFWMRVLDVPKSSFNKAYVKNSLHADKTYKGLFGHGTCSVSYHDRDIHEYIMAALAYIRTRDI